MGICSSCLGGRRDDYEEEDERLLLDDPNTIAGYGSFGEQQNAAQEDGETQREMESLQRVVAKTADNMVDIFEIAPLQDSASAPAPPVPPFAYAGQGVRAARYQHLAARLSAGDDVNVAASLAAASTGDRITVDWIGADGEDDDVDDDDDGDDDDDYGDEARSPSPSALKLPDRPLVGNFADAAAAMGPQG